MAKPKKGLSPLRAEKELAALRRLYEDHMAIGDKDVERLEREILDRLLAEDE
jgi:hypothetical protein